jgi:hypothetical protein
LDVIDCLRQCLRSGVFPVVLDKFGAVMQDLVARCLSGDPKSRPSFAGIFSEFNSHDFAILPGADPVEIKQAVSEVLAWEDRPSDRANMK